MSLKPLEDIKNDCLSFLENCAISPAVKCEWIELLESIDLYDASSKKTIDDLCGVAAAASDAAGAEKWLMAFSGSMQRLKTHFDSFHAESIVRAYEEKLGIPPRKVIPPADDD